MHRHRYPSFVRLAAALFVVSLLVAACGSDDAIDATESPAPAETDASPVADPSPDGDPTPAPELPPATPEESDATGDVEASGDSAPDTVADPACEDTASLFVTRGSANPDLVDPAVEATCDGASILVVSNGVPDYTYIGTSPGAPDGREFTFTIAAQPVMADTATEVPYIGPIGVTLGGIAIYGPTEGTGGDVDSLPGIISECGSHNGPGGFHTHKILASENTDCFFTPAEVAAEPQLAGFAFDGFPIYTGIDQYTSSWQLTDESLFATDTWAAHTYVEGSGDLDQCNGRTDEDGNYAYYTTEAFPYVLGCFVGEVTLDSPGDEGDDRPERPEGDDDRPERPEPPEGDDGQAPEPPVEGDEGSEGAGA